MKTIARCVLVAVVVLIDHSLFAADEAHRKAAADLLEATNTRKVMDSTMDQMLEAQIKANAQLAPLRGVMKQFLNKHLGYDSMKDDLITLYTEEFTEDELKQLAAFYQSPVGKKASEKLPTLMAKGGQLGMQRVQANQAELQQMVKDEIEKEKAAK